MPIDHTLYKLSSAIASNTGNAQDYMAPWDSVVVAEAGTLRGAFAVATSLTSNAAGPAHQVDIFRQPSGVSGASNSSASILTAPITLIGNNTSVAGSIAAGNQRVAAGDILQLKTNEKGAVGRFVNGLSAIVLVLPD